MLAILERHDQNILLFEYKPRNTKRRRQTQLLDLYVKLQTRHQ